MGLTVEQRLRELERGNIVLHDTIKLLHNLLKEQKELINSYIVRKMTSADTASHHKDEQGITCDEIYTFMCNKKFDKIDKDIERILKSIESSKFGRRAG